MTDSTAIAIVSVGVSGLTAVASPAIAARIESRRDSTRAARERWDRDLVELRQLLDEAAVSAEAARICSRRLSRLFAGHDPGGVEAILSARGELVNEGRHLSQLQSRIAVRLGADHLACSACADTANELRSLNGLWEEWTDLYPDGPFGWAVQLELEDAYTKARDNFVQAAQGQVGAETG